MAKVLEDKQLFLQVLFLKLLLFLQKPNLIGFVDTEKVVETFVQLIGTGDRMRDRFP